MVTSAPRTVSSMPMALLARLCLQSPPWTAGDSLGGLAMDSLRGQWEWVV